jgi:hypothetical protein
MVSSVHFSLFSFLVCSRRYRDVAIRLDKLRMPNLGMDVTQSARGARETPGALLKSMYGTDSTPILPR